MKAFKCDRCGGYYSAPEDKPNYKPGSYVNVREGEKSGINGDLCPECTLKLQKWWSKGKKKRTKK